MTRALPLLLALAALTACGRPGPIRPPGPPSEVIYPRVYPYERPPGPGGPAAVSPGAVPGPGTTR